MSVKIFFLFQNAIESANSLIKDQNKNIDPLQKMIFLMNNWDKPHEQKFGFDGGSEYIQKRFFVDSKDPRYEELTRTHFLVSSSFEPTICFLLPRQGNGVNFKYYEGQWSLLDEEMKNELVTFIENVLSPSNLMTKKINGKELSAAEFLQVVKDYSMKMDNSNKKISIPEVGKDQLVFPTRESIAEKLFYAARDQKFYRV